MNCQTGLRFFIYVPFLVFIKLLRIKFALKNLLWIKKFFAEGKKLDTFTVSSDLQSEEGTYTDQPRNCSIVHVLLLTFYSLKLFCKERNT